MKLPQRIFSYTVFRGCNIMCHHRDMTATEKKQQAARARLDELSAAYTEAEGQFEEARQALNKAIVDVLKARVLGPSEVTRHVPYERQHVGRIAKAAGIPPLRERTVVSIKQAAGGETSG